MVTAAAIGPDPGLPSGKGFGRQQCKDENGGHTQLLSIVATQIAAQEGSKKHFAQIILAAADVDADLFRQGCTAFSVVGLLTTLYVLDGDHAVETARWFYKSLRVGFLPPILSVSRIDTVNVTNTDFTLLGHGYVADVRDVLADMHQLITEETELSKRFSIRAAHTESPLHNG